MSSLAEPLQQKPIDVSQLVTEDDTPVDSIFQEKQGRLLTESLYSSWFPKDRAGQARKFAAMSNVGVFSQNTAPVVVPDMLLAMDVEVPEGFWEKAKRSYYVWEYRKSPDLIIEVISNREGKELDDKIIKCTQLGVKYFVAFDHLRLYSYKRLHVYKHYNGVLVPMTHARFPDLGLALTEWNGTFEDKDACWLRWCQLNGTLIDTGRERADQAEDERDREKHRADQAEQRIDREKHRADQAEHRADQAEHRIDREKHRADQAEQRIKELTEKLRQLGIES